MHHKFARGTGPVLLLLLLAGSLLAAPNLPLLPEHKEWLEIVTPIITKTEREVFLKLQTNPERSKFIQLFWRQRDTSPDTSENEFYKEYMSRVNFADQNFGYGTGKRGCLTERGFYYLILGPPLERTLYTTYSELLPMELWFYKGDPRYGLPAFFYLIFYQPMGMGEYRLYYPGVEGPEKLVIQSMSQQMVTRASAYQTIRKANAELASATLSYLPGDRPQGMPSFSSDQIIASVRDLPEKEFSDVYARNYLNYKDFVETEYTDTYTESTFVAKVFRVAGANFLHWCLEPSRVNFAERNGSFYASFELVLRLEDSARRTVYEQTEEIPLQVSPEQFKRHARQRFAFQDILPVIPGEFRVLFLLKNKTGKDFSSQEARVSVPRESGPAGLGPILLYSAKDAAPAADSRTAKAFALDGSQFLFDARGEFSKTGTLGVYVQPINLRKAVPDPALASVQAEIRSADSPAVVWSAKRGLAEVMPAGRTGIDWQGISLAELKPGYYDIEVSLLDPAGQRLVSQRDHFIILTQAASALPWSYSRQRPAFPAADQLNILGSEHLAMGEYDRARDILAQSLAMKDAAPTRLLLAKAQYGRKSFQDSLTLVTPVYESTHDREAAKVIALDYAALQDWSSALVYLKALLREATEVEVLNLTAECLIHLGRAEEALPLLKKSQEISPGQAEVRRLEELAKQKH